MRWQSEFNGHCPCHVRSKTSLQMSFRPLLRWENLTGPSVLPSPSHSRPRPRPVRSARVCACCNNRGSASKRKLWRLRSLRSSKVEAVSTADSGNLGVGFISWRKTGLCRCKERRLPRERQLWMSESFVYRKRQNKQQTTTSSFNWALRLVKAIELRLIQPTCACIVKPPWRFHWQGLKQRRKTTVFSDGRPMKILLETSG